MNKHRRFLTAVMICVCNGVLALGLNLSISTSVAAADEVDTSAVPVTLVNAFPKLQWTGWKPITDDGLSLPIRPIVVTHAGDDSGRLFIATQRGVIHVIDNNPDVEKSEIFFDMSSKVHYDDKQNEEGFLGFAFHPRYKENGEFFVYYTTTEAAQTSVISRFRVSKDNPQKADVEFEEELLRIQQPAWNHNGGGLIFGGDGHLYISLGDGGKGNDFFKNAQNLTTLMGAILRIDVDNKDEGKNYAIPKDNPFAKFKRARGEIWAYGLRNVWGMSYDKERDLFWAADVGQNLWEEIDLIERGGNYGWNVREGLHEFVDKEGNRPGLTKRGRKRKMIDPIWEYHHDIGKSITGGHVYRGQAVPELQGKYLYADYVSGKVWALNYDAKMKKVVGNHPVPDAMFQAISFGTDQQGEVYITKVAPDGHGVYKFARAGQ